MNNETMQLLERHFDTAFAAPDGIKKLRELILTLAMQGKLVPLNPNDPPASELLKEIEAEKQRLVKEGKLKKPTPLPPIRPEEVPYLLPQRWVWVRLDMLTSKIGSGSTPRGGKSTYVPKGIPFLRSQNIWNDGIKLDDVAFISLDTHRKMLATTVMAKDVLLNITGASLGRTSLVDDGVHEANVSQHVTIIRCLNKEQRRFIHFFLQSP